MDVHDSQLSQVKLPPKMKQKGLPKGCGQTVIGVGKKRATAEKKKPMKFSKKKPEEKDRVILQWFVGRHAAEAALLGKILTENDIKRDVKEIPSVCLDENIELHRVRPYFTKEGWKHVLDALQTVREIGWLCKVCRMDLTGEQIGCDGCCQWLHYHCAGIKVAPKAKTWFCSDCRANI